MSLMGWMKRPRLWFRRDAAALEQSLGRGSASKMRLVRVAKFGIYVDHEDTLIGAGVVKFGAYEPHLGKLITRLLKPGDAFLDLGSNIGYHTLTAAKRVGSRGRCIAVDLESRQLRPLTGQLRVQRVFAGRDPRESRRCKVRAAFVLHNSEHQQ